MAYWWVSQNKTFKEERAGGFMWAPKLDVEGNTLFHWSNMTLVQPGDIIFSYAQKAIGALGIASSTAYDFKKPINFAEGIWDEAGWRVEVEYRTLSKPLVLADVIPKLTPLLPAYRSPISSSNTPNQGYLYAIPPGAGQLLLDSIAVDIDSEIELGFSSIENPTTRAALVKARIGQGQFRDQLIDYWEGRCALTGLEVVELLRASHIKPWRDSNNTERLDVFNGFLLAPGCDAAFDAGFISFSPEGEIQISPRLDQGALTTLGLTSKMKLNKVHAKHLPYLDHHRAAFLKGVK
jgi:HNH endonuclease